MMSDEKFIIYHSSLIILLPIFASQQNNWASDRVQFLKSN
jgi:hypothetical protein